MKKLLLLPLALIIIATLAAYFIPSVRAQIFPKKQFQLSTGEWTTVEGAIEIIKQTLEQSSASQIAADLYSFMTEEEKEMFSFEDFKKSISETDFEVLNAEIIGEGDEFAKVKMRLKSSDQEKDFLVVLKKENGVWKLFGTEEM